MDLTRRQVLKGAGSLPMIFGLAAVGCRARRDDPLPPPHVSHDKDGAPWYWRTFLERRSPVGAARVVLRVPEDAAVAHEFGTVVVDLAARGTTDERILFVEGVFVFLTSAEIQRLVPRAKESDAYVLVDAQAARLDGVAATTADLVRRDSVAKAIRSLVEGPQGYDLEKGAARVRAEIERTWSGEKDPERLDDAMLGSANVDRTWPWIALQRRATHDPGQRMIFDAALAKGIDERSLSTLRMPYGAELDSEGGGCGKPGESVACGMAMPIPSSYRFLRYLTAKTG